MNNSNGPRGFGADDFHIAEGAGEYASAHAERSNRLKEFVSAVMILVEALRAYRKGEFKMSWRELALVTTTLLYVVSPFDAVPDVIPGGFVDDLGVVAAALVALASMLQRFRLTKA